MKRALLIANPRSGRGLSHLALGSVVGALAGGGYLTSVITTAAEFDAGALTRQFAPGMDLVVCAGGDGTLSQVVSGLMSMYPRPPVGYIPNGTANDVARALALPHSPQLAVRRILEGRPTPTDVGGINGEFFTYIAAFGAFTGVSYQTTQAAKRALGHLAYVFGAIGSIGDIKPRRASVQYDGGAVEGDFIFGGVTNSTSLAGMIKLPHERVQLADGRFEILLVRKPVSLLSLQGIIANIVAGHYNSDNVMLLQTGSARFQFDEPVAWTRDGEDGGMIADAEIQNFHNAIDIII